LPTRVEICFTDVFAGAGKITPIASKTLPVPFFTDGTFERLRNGLGARAKNHRAGKISCGYFCIVLPAHD
jgi:hypothetical protein